MDFYNLLYRGYTGEYQLVSSLYRNGLDAVRSGRRLAQPEGAA